MDLSQRLDKAMQLRGVRSQSALARDSGVPQPTINRILKGTTPTPDHATLKRLSTALDVELEWLSAEIGRGPDSPKREANSPLSDEAELLIQCVLRLDRLGAMARKTFAAHITLLMLAEQMLGMQDAEVERELHIEEQKLASHIDQSRAPKHATREHKTSKSSY